MDIAIVTLLSIILGLNIFIVADRIHDKFALRKVKAQLDEQSKKIQRSGKRFRKR